MLFVAGSPFLIEKIKQDEILSIEKLPDDSEGDVYAVVFGAGIGRNGGPSDALYDRLTVAAQLYKSGKVTQILVSGDNPTLDYNEPEVMSTTLQEAFAIPEEVITEDYAGRRSYDTCIRAKEVFGVSKAILVTQDFHLPRAIYTCQSLGLDAVGVSASLQPYIFGDYYELREYFATLKMLVDLYIWAPAYIK